MSDTNKFTAAQQKRAKDQLRKSQAGQRYIEKLHADNGVQAIYAPEFDDEKIVEGTWFHSSQKGLPQQVKLLEYDAASDNEFDEDTITFQRKRSSQSEAEYQVLGAPVKVRNAQNNFPITVTMPAEYMNDEGVFDFRFHVVTEFGSQGWSPEARMTLDWTPPAGAQIPAAVEFADGLLIDSEYLAQLPGGKLVVTIPPYPQRASTDKIIWAWLSELPNGVEIPVADRHGADLPDNHEVEIPVDVIRNAGEGDGRCYFVYILFDKAENWSHLSNFRAVAVSLRPAPGPVEDPQIPLADDGLYYADIAAGIEVLIPELLSFDRGDRVYVKWGNTELDYREIGIAPEFPLRIPVPITALRNEYPLGTPGEVQTVVSYEVRRGQNVWPSQPVTIDVDFSTIGPINPDWPDPVNPDLPQLTVKPFSGNDNEIIGEDNLDKGATVEFEIYQPRAQGQIIQLYWNNQPVGTPYTVLGTEADGDIITLPVTWDQIRAAGDNLQMPVFYGIRASTDSNEVRCRIRSVRVLVVPIVLAAPSFPQAGDRNIICEIAQMDHGRIHVSVPYDAKYVYEGTQVTVHWRGFLRADMSDGLPPHAGDPVAISNRDLPLTWYSANHTVFVEPATECLFPLHDATVPYGFCECYYSVEINGVIVVSESITRLVGMGNPDGICVIPPRLAN